MASRGVSRVADDVDCVAINVLVESSPLVLVVAAPKAAAFSPSRRRWRCPADNGAGKSPRDSNCMVDDD